MSNFKETKKPYEFLVRFNEDGSISGAHVGWLEQVYKDDVVINRSEKVEAVAIGNDAGFPLATILNEVQISALIDLEIAKKEIESLQKNEQFLKEQIAILEKNQEKLIEELKGK